MDGEIDTAIQQGLVKFLGEQSLAPRLDQPAVLNSVPGGDDGNDLSSPFGMSLGQGLPKLPGLSQGQRRATSADAQGSECGHGFSLLFGE